MSENSIDVPDKPDLDPVMSRSSAETTITRRARNNSASRPGAIGPYAGEKHNGAVVASSAAATVRHVGQREGWPARHAYLLEAATGKNATHCPSGEKKDSARRSDV